MRVAEADPRGLTTEKASDRTKGTETLDNAAFFCYNKGRREDDLH